jgi:hypothetical protein
MRLISHSALAAATETFEELSQAPGNAIYVQSAARLSWSESYFTRMLYLLLMSQPDTLTQKVPVADGLNLAGIGGPAFEAPTVPTSRLSLLTKATRPPPGRSR